IHRDVKPSNILLTEDRSPIVGDFGLAHLPDDEPAPSMVSEPLTQAGMRIGTPSYMAPEQVRGDPIDGRIDQYSLAVVAYELLAGRPPFSGDTPYATMLKHVHEAPPPPSSSNPGLDGTAERALLRALAKDPRDRFATCSEFVRALAAAGRNGDSQDGAAVIMPGPAPRPEPTLVAPQRPAASSDSPAAPPTEFVAPMAPGAARAPFVGTTAAVPDVAAPAPSAAPPSRRGPMRGRTIAIAAAALVVPAAVIVAIVAAASGSKQAPRPTQANQSPATAPATGTATATETATAAATQGASSGALPATVLYSDLFRDAQKSKMERTPPNDAAHYHFAVANNEFVIMVTDPNFQAVPEAHLPGTYDDATLTVDALLQGSVEAPYVVLGCHQQGDGDDGYRFEV